MNTGGDAAEQIVRMSLEGFEVAAKLTGAGAKNIAVVLYCVLADRKNKDPQAEVDVIARAEDASKISRIVERFNLASVDTASIVTEVEKAKDEKTDMPEPDIGVQEKAEKDKLLDALMGKPTQKEENAPENPSVAKTEKSPQSEPLSEKPSKSAEGATMTDKKPSVKEELRKIKESRKEQEADAPVAQDKSRASDRATGKVGKTEHKHPQRKKKKPKSKETR